MGLFRDLLRRMAGFLADADPAASPKPGRGLEELAARRLRALQEGLEVVDAQMRLADRNRRDLQRLVAEAKAVEAIGKQALSRGDRPKAETAMAHYAAMQEGIRSLTVQAEAADRQAAAAAGRFRADAAAAQRAAAEARALVQLEAVIELQKKHQAMTLAQSAAAQEFEAAREKLLLAAAVQAASLRLQNDLDAVDREIAAGLNQARAEAVGRRWQSELVAGQTAAPEGEEDPADSAIRFLERPPLDGSTGTGPKK